MWYAVQDKDSKTVTDTYLRLVLIVSDKTIKTHHELGVASASMLIVECFKVLLTYAYFSGSSQVHAGCQRGNLLIIRSNSKSRLLSSL
jgi:hypothetical protein